MPANLGDIFATTLANRQSELEDAVTNNVALLYYLKNKGQIKSIDSGRTIIEPLIYADNTNAAFYEGYDTFTIANDEVVDASEYQWKQQGGFATISGIEQIKNSGRSQAVNLLEARQKALKATLANQASVSIFGDGTGTSGKEFGGLQLLVADDPTAVGTVGGIPQNTNAFWQNRVQTVGGLLTSVNVQQQMNQMILQCQNTGGSRIDLIVAGNIHYTRYWESLQQNQRFMNEKTAEAGFMNLKFQNADMLFDPQCANSRSYYLDSEYICMRAHSTRRWAVGDKRTVTNGDSIVIPVWMAGNLTVSNRRWLGILLSTDL